MKAHSLDLRERVVRACEEGTQTQKAIAERFEVSYWFVVKIWQQWRRTGDLCARKRGGRCVPAIRGPALQRLKRALGAHPDATLEELQRSQRASLQPGHSSQHAQAFGLSP